MTVRDLFAVAQTSHLPAARLTIAFVLDGWGQFESGEVAFQLRPGNVVLLPKGRSCTCQPRGFLRSISFELDDELAASWSRWLPESNVIGGRLRGAISHRGSLGLLDIGMEGMRHIGPRLAFMAQRKRQAGDALAVIADAADVTHTVGMMCGIRHTAATVIGGARARLPRREVATAVRLMREDLTRRWTAGELASAVAISQSQLSRLFQAELGLSPMSYLWRMRVDRMAELLATKAMSVASAAAEAGWCHPSTASRAFRRRFGVTPLQFAARVRTVGVARQLAGDTAAFVAVDRDLCEPR